jgi:hypothetical protein
MPGILRSERLARPRNTISGFCIAGKDESGRDRAWPLQFVERDNAESDEFGARDALQSSGAGSEADYGESERIRVHGLRCEEWLVIEVSARLVVVRDTDASVPESREAARSTRFRRLMD